MPLPITFEHAHASKTSDQATTVRINEPDILPERPVEEFSPQQEVAFATIRKTMARRKRSV